MDTGIENWRHLAPSIQAVSDISASDVKASAAANKRGETLEVPDK
jgi:hypothetical protein